MPHILQASFGIITHLGTGWHTSKAHTRCNAVAKSILPAFFQENRERRRRLYNKSLEWKIASRERREPNGWIFCEDHIIRKGSHA